MAVAAIARSMSRVANGSAAEVTARTSPAGSMIQPLPPHAPVVSTRLEDRLNAPERTAATTPAASHFAAVANAVARGDSSSSTPSAA